MSAPLGGALGLTRVPRAEERKLFARLSRCPQPTLDGGASSASDGPVVLRATVAGPPHPPQLSSEVVHLATLRVRALPLQVSLRLLCAQAPAQKLHAPVAPLQLHAEELHLLAAPQRLRNPPARALRRWGIAANGPLRRRCRDCRWRGQCSRELRLGDLQIGRGFRQGSLEPSLVALQRLLSRSADGAGERLLREAHLDGGAGRRGLLELRTAERKRLCRLLGPAIARLLVLLQGQALRQVHLWRRGVLPRHLIHRGVVRRWQPSRRLHVGFPSLCRR
mmetsp:Transcript_30537/g.85163  ORF Transcript_30537/g.85163 Transcript_30537/m.85163 type:complete len:278 (+) Transcript_30537:217-1050(+)